MLHAVIMAGGRGERFWPESRISRPKQFLNLIGNETMIQATTRRINKLIPHENIYIVTNQIYKDLVREQLPMIEEVNIIIEPMAKNTAACIGLACAFIKKRDDNASMIVLPSDHLITEEEKFISLVDTGFKKAAKDEYLVTLGIKPQYPETGYGYIKLGKYEEDMSFKVECFVEKPDLEKAEEYLRQGNYLWNSGMFIWKIDSIISKFRIHMPQLFESILKIGKSIGKDEQELIIKEEFNKLESISIDYGIMENAKGIYVIPCDFGWDDVGSWTSLERLNSKDNEGNIITGKVIGVDTHRCIFKGNKKLIAAVGVEDLIVVDTDDAILICTKDKSQNIKQLIGQIKECSMDSYL